MSRTQGKPERRDNHNPAGPVAKRKDGKYPAGVSDDTRVIHSDESNPDD